MSIESAQAFYSRITTDEALRTQFQQAATQEERILILQVNGYQFTQKEWATVTAQNQASTPPDSELSDAELTAVSGGATPDITNPELQLGTPNPGVVPTTPVSPMVPINPAPAYGGPGVW